MELSVPTSLADALLIKDSLMIAAAIFPAPERLAMIERYLDIIDKLDKEVK